MLGGRRKFFTGTSFACPHVTGIAARLKSRLPGLTTFELRSLLHNRGSDSVRAG